MEEKDWKGRASSIEDNEDVWYCITRTCSCVCGWYVIIFADYKCEKVSETSEGGGRGICERY